MQTLTVSIIQAELHWHDAARNRELFTAAIKSIDGPVDLIVLPEMFTSGFTMDAAANAETMDGQSIAWMRDMAVTAKAAVCGSLIIEADGGFYNRFVYMPPEGELRSYDKRHLFRLAGEQRHYSPGSETITFELNGFRICPMICNDLRFPVWSRNRGAYDVLIYVANWPDRRHFAWDTLLRARAIENLSFVVGVNRTGVDGNGLAYLGRSCIIDYLGAELTSLQDKNGIASATLNKMALLEYRQHFGFDKDADRFRIE